MAVRNTSLRGIHAQICRRLQTAGVLPCSLTDLQIGLEHSNNHDRSHKAAALIREIWHSDEGLGVAPALSELLRHENEGTFYDQYRDHVVHTLEVYLLGLDLLASLPELWKRLASRFGELEVRRCWTVAALGHDHGYIFEVPGRFQVPQPLQSLLTDPLSDFDFLPPGTLQAIGSHITARKHDAVAIESLEKFGETDFFDWIAPDIRVDFSVEANGLRMYHDFARRYGRQEFDHGISSALVLFQFHHRLKEQLLSIPKDLKKGIVTTSQKAKLTALATAVVSAEASIRAGCAAIALHNIRKDIWDEAQKQEAERKGLRLSEFTLSLDVDPLAWLLGFADTLQRWNRPVARGRAHRVGQFVRPEDISLEYVDGVAHFAYLNERDVLRATGESPFFKLRLDLINYLKVEDVDFILASGTPQVRTRSRQLTDAPHVAPVASNYHDLGVISSETTGSVLTQIKQIDRLHPDQLPVFVLYTGGSVGMVRKDPDDPKSPLVTEEKLSRILEYLKRIAELPFDIDFFRTPTVLDSSNMLPSHWIEMAKIVYAVHKHYQGFVVLHGTDTMTFTASALSFLLKNLDKPVILTGAERPISEIGNDAESNIMRSLLLAASSEGSRVVPEVCLFFGNLLLRGNRAKKMRALAFQGFESPNCEPLGRVEDAIDINARVVRDKILTDRHGQQFDIDTTLDDRVAILELYPSTETCIQSLEQQLSSKTTRGLILKTYGTGNAPTLPERFLEIIETAVKDGKVIVNLTHCPMGQVEVRLFETNARLFELGVINGGDMTVEAAYTKLMWLLAKYGGNEDDETDLPAIRRDFQLNLRGELRFSAYNLVYRNVVVPFDKPFRGASQDIGSFDPSEINHAYVRIHGIALKAPPDQDFDLDVYFSHPRIAGVAGEKDARRFIGRVRRAWAGAPLTCNLDATEVVRKNAAQKDLLSLQVVANAKHEVSIATLQLSIFTENVKGN